MKSIALIIFLLGAIILAGSLLSRTLSHRGQLGNVGPPIPSRAYAVDVGDPVMAHFSNVVGVVMHTNDCYLITWIGDDKTNEFHAWNVPVKIYFTNF